MAQVNARFAAALVSMAGLDPPSDDERYEVGTQRGTLAADGSIWKSSSRRLIVSLTCSSSAITGLSVSAEKKKSARAPARGLPFAAHPREEDVRVLGRKRLGQ